MQGNRSKGVMDMVLNTMTAKIKITGHYCWSFARKADSHNQERTHRLREGGSKVFREHEMIFGAQQKAIRRRTQYIFCNLRIDPRSTGVRKLIDLLLAEQVAVKAAAQ